MNTQYVSFILRLRLNERQSQDHVDHKVSGSVQQVGLQEIRYFDSAEKLKETLQQLLPEMTAFMDCQGNHPLDEALNKELNHG